VVDAEGLFGWRALTNRFVLKGEHLHGLKSWPHFSNEPRIFRKTRETSVRVLKL